MVKAAKLAVCVGLLASLHARAEMVNTIPGSHYMWVGNYKTGAALYAECVHLVSSLGHDPASFCGTSAPNVKPGSYARVNAGWLLDYSQKSGVNRYVYLNAYACADNKTVHYDAREQRCAHP